MNNLVKILAQEAGIKRSVAKEALEAVFAYVKTQEEIKIMGFGKFYKTQISARTGIVNGKPYTSDAREVLRFKQYGK